MLGCDVLRWGWWCATGYPFCHGARAAALLLERHDLERVASDSSNAIVLRIGALIFSLLAALCSYWLSDRYVDWIYRGPQTPHEALVKTVATRSSISTPTLRTLHLKPQTPSWSRRPPLPGRASQP